jgi:hypothetical protein
MGTFGELFPGRKLRSEAGAEGTGEPADRGPVDLDSGVVRLGGRRQAEHRTQAAEADTSKTVSRPE